MMVSSRLFLPGRASARARARSGLVLLGLVCLFLLVPAMRGTGFTGTVHLASDPVTADADAAAAAAVAAHVSRP